jgi:hypothetical protein
MELEKVFVVVGYPDAAGNPAIWATFDKREKAERYPGPRMFETFPKTIIEYVRVDPLSDERARIIAREIVGNVYAYAEDNGELSMSAFESLTKRIAVVIAANPRAG